MVNTGQAYTDASRIAAARGFCIKLSSCAYDVLWFMVIGFWLPVALETDGSLSALFCGRLSDHSRDIELLRPLRGKTAAFTFHELTSHADIGASNTLELVSGWC